jgi:DNA ligase-1
MTFLEFCQNLEKLETIASRNEMTVALAELFEALKPNEIKPALYLLTGRIAPQFLPIEFNFSTKLIVKALAEYSGKDAETALAEYKQLGDIGLFAQSLLPKEQKTKSSLSLIDVFARLQNVALQSGSNSQAAKQKQYLEFIKQSSGVEAKFLSRILVGSLRLGLSVKTLLDALSWAVTGDKSLRPLIEHAYGVCVDIAVVAEMTLVQGKESLEKSTVIPGIPVASKLVEREKGSEAIFERLGSCYIQPKFDGLRVQIHYNKKGFNDLPKSEPTAPGLFAEAPEIEKVRIFSRNLENLTPMLPDLVAAIQTLPVDSIVVDGEALGINWENGNFLPFQETIKRKRKHQVNEMANSVPLQANLFDVLFLNGDDLLRHPLSERYTTLAKVLAAGGDRRLKLSENTEAISEAEITALFTKYTSQNLEGIIAKAINSTYDPGTRNYDWIKLKASSDKQLVDTIDAVVLGFYYGEGARAKFGIGAILTGIYDADNDRFVSLAKIGTGFKDEDWANIKVTLEPFVVAELPKNVIIEKTLMPDVLVTPGIVVVIEADSISRSKIHGVSSKAKKNDLNPVEGLSLRFPRIKVFGRDKSPTDATTTTELERMFALQEEESASA